jgi:hypothetical protein
VSPERAQRIAECFQLTLDLYDLSREPDFNGRTRSG